MFRDLSVPSFKSDYSALTSTSGLRLFEWILNSCLGYCRARWACTLPQYLAHCAEEKRAAEMNRWRGSDQAKPPITKILQSLPKPKHCSTDHPPMVAKTTKNKGRSLNCDWCEMTGCTQDTLASAVNSHEIPESLFGTLFTESQTGLLCTVWSDYIQKAFTFGGELT